jgi:transposase
LWRTGRCASDFKTSADVRRDKGTAICAACARFIAIMSRFQRVNARDKTFTRGAVTSQIAHLEKAIERSLIERDAADRHQAMGLSSDSGRLRETLGRLEAQMETLTAMEKAVADAPERPVCLTDPDADVYAASGAFGITEASDFWRIRDGQAWSVTHGQDVPDFDAGTLALIRKGADGAWGSVG